ncbi:MAG: dihydroorotate dehydrogenase electron transfer subunit [Candidatus Aminicenantes bacterium]|nr:dihydroorotate dehydrogenase electron transfer subunit [Candidatus Aminicenantes bacterium]
MLKNHTGKITRKEIWGDDYFLLSLEAPDISRESQPGQFVMVRTSTDPYPLLRRPFSIHGRNGSHIDIFFQKTGIGTSLLSQKQKGDPLEILGPLGNGFLLEDGTESKKVSLIGGGRGIAPLYFLAQELNKNQSKVRIFYGGRSSKDIPLLSKFKKENIETLCSTEDGSTGFQGLVTELFEQEMNSEPPSLICACGPDGMLKKVSQISEKNHIPAELSLESIMGCGFGACWGCVKKIKKENIKQWQKICEEGPVFWAHEIVWDE